MVTVTLTDSKWWRPLKLSLVAILIAVTGLLFAGSWTNSTLSSLTVFAGPSQVYVSVHRKDDSLYARMAEIRWLLNGWSSERLILSNSRTIEPHDITLTRDSVTGNIVIRVGSAEWVADLTQRQIIPTVKQEFTSN